MRGEDRTIPLGIQEEKSSFAYAADYNRLSPMQETREALVQFIQAKLLEKNLAPAVASKKIGKNHAYLQQFFSRNVPRALPEETRHLLAMLIGVDETCLKVSGAARSGELKDDITVSNGNNTHIGAAKHWEEDRNMGDDGLTGAVLKSVLARLDRIDARLDSLTREPEHTKSDPHRRRKR
jgi:hypothetical protein